MWRQFVGESRTFVSLEIYLIGEVGQETFCSQAQRNKTVKTWLLVYSKIRFQLIKDGGLQIVPCRQSRVQAGAQAGGNIL